MPKVLLGLIFLSSMVQAANREVLQFWHFSIDEKNVRSIEEDFEKRYPEIDIQIQQLSWDFGHDKIVTSLIAKNAPDVFEIGSTWGPKFIQSDVLLDITDQVASWESEYLMWEPVSHHKKRFGVPWLLGTRFIFYNKTLFEQAGLKSPPRTWDELYKAAQAIHALGPDIYGYGICVAEDFTPWQTFLPYVWNAGGDVLTPDWSRASLDSQPTRAALSFFQKLKPYSLLNRQNQIDQLFAAGKVGVMLSGAWNINQITKTNPSLRYGVSTVPTPKIGQKPFSFGGGEMLVIKKETSHPDAALLWIKYLVSKQVSTKISLEQKNVLPSAKLALKDEHFQKDEYFRGFAEQMLSIKAPPAHVGWIRIGKLISSALDSIFLQNESVDSLLQKTDSEINKILAQTDEVGKYPSSLLTIFIFVIVAIGGGLLYLFRKGGGPQGSSSSWIFVSPWVILFVVFGLYPLIYSLIISFTDFNVLTSRFSFSGVENYIKSFQDPDFLKAIFHTLTFALGTIPFTVGISLILAAIIHQNIPWKSLFQAGFFLPVVTSIIVISMLFTYFYAENGILNLFLTKIGLTPPEPSWLINQKWALVSIMAMAVWSSVGYYLILFLAGLQSIPTSLYEASRLDGATRIQQFFKITLPQLKPIILFVIVINTINSFQVFPEIFTMTKGGPARSTTTVVYYLYEKGFSDFQMGTASAIAYILAALIGVFAFFQMRLLKERT